MISNVNHADNTTHKKEADYPVADFVAMHLCQIFRRSWVFIQPFSNSNAAKMQYGPAKFEAAKGTQDQLDPSLVANDVRLRHKRSSPTATKSTAAKGRGWTSSLQHLGVDQQVIREGSR